MGAVALVLGMFLTEASQAANLVWTNAANGDWGVAANWQPNAIPGASDTAWITNSGTYTVSLSANTTVANLTLGGVSGVQTFNLKGPYVLTLIGSGLGRTTNGIFQLGGGTLNIQGGLTLNGPLVWR